MVETTTHGMRDGGGDRRSEGTRPGPPTSNEVRGEGVTQVPAQETSERNRRNQEATGSQHNRIAEGGSTEQTQLVNAHANGGECSERGEGM